MGLSFENWLTIAGIVVAVIGLFVVTRVYIARKNHVQKQTVMGSGRGIQSGRDSHVGKE